MSTETWRLRDPIHGLITFRKDDAVDRLAWKLIQTSEFQRLRRIRQLGISEFVFPGATHTRFAHSIGVFHNARRLMEVIRQEEGRDFKQERRQVALVAALLHDLGHGPLSHAFEGAREVIAENRGQSAIETHEKFTAKLILAEDGGIRPILNKTDASLAEQVAALVRADDPADIYHAVVSSSFDADRLDYLKRDRYMTGTGAGSIDEDWLIDNLATCVISVSQDNEDVPVPTFAFKLKGRQAAEDFLLARYRLFNQVYLHKTTRGFEKIATALFQRISEAAIEGNDLGLGQNHPFIRFFQAECETLDNYRALDDYVLWGAIERLTRESDGETKRLAERLWHRQPLRTLDISPHLGHDIDEYHNALRRLRRFSTGMRESTVFEDNASYNLYAGDGGEAGRAHKVIRVFDGHGKPKQIQEFSDTIIREELTRKSQVTRFYFLEEEDRRQAEKVMRGG
jgi:HD superfamily phosphohydrolase